MFKNKLYGCKIKYKYKLLGSLQNVITFHLIYKFFKSEYFLVLLFYKFLISCSLRLNHLVNFVANIIQLSTIVNIVCINVFFFVLSAFFLCLTR